MSKYLMRFFYRKKSFKMFKNVTYTINILTNRVSYKVSLDRNMSSCSTYASLRRDAFVNGRPSSVMVPACVVILPAKAFNSVVLPEPVETSRLFVFIQVHFVLYRSALHSTTYYSTTFILLFTVCHILV